MRNLLKHKWLSPSSNWAKDNCLVRPDKSGKLVFMKDELGRVRSKANSYLGSVNLYAGFFIMLNTGMRMQELLDLRWKDIKEESLGTSTGGTRRSVYILRVLDKKPMRRNKTPNQTRPVVAPQRIGHWLEMIKEQNPLHCGPDDYLINLNGKRRKTLSFYFDKLRHGEPSDDKIGNIAPTYKGKTIDLFHHEEGTRLTMGHLRSYYVSKKLIDDGVSPYILERQTGHGIETILSYYLSRTPSYKTLLKLGGWELDDRHTALGEAEEF